MFSTKMQKGEGQSCTSSNVVSTASEVKPASVSSSIFLFLIYNIIHEKNKNKIIKALNSKIDYYSH